MAQQRESGNYRRYEQDEDNENNMARRSRGYRATDDDNRSRGMRDQDNETGYGQYRREASRGYGGADVWDEQNRGREFGSRGNQDRSWNRDDDWTSRNNQYGYGRGREWGGGYGYNEGGYDQRGNDYGGALGQPQTRYGQQGQSGFRDERYPYTGQGYGQSYGQGYGRDRDRQGPDEQYMTWREEQVRRLDEDYDAYRKENQTKFNSDFDTWRSKRTRPADKDKTSNGNTTTKQ